MRHLFVIALITSASCYAQQTPIADIPRSDYFAAWVGGSSGPHGAGLTFGISYSFLGMSASMVDLGQLSPEIPDHFDYEIPHDDSEEARYDGAIYGVDVLGVFSPLRWFTVQGSIGLYARDVTFLDRSKATDLYYASPKGTTLTDLTATAGGGLHFNFPFGLLIGANYNTVRGFGMFVGYREAIEPEPVKR